MRAALLTLLAAAAAPVRALNASVVHGLLSVPGGGAPVSVGPLTSSLNAAIATAFPPLPNLSPNSNRALHVNSSLLHYLTLSGNFSVDVPLVLPPRLVLVLRGATLRAAPNFTGTALILINGSRFAKRSWRLAAPATRSSAAWTRSWRGENDGPTASEIPR